MAAVPGVDGIFVGPGDLGLRLQRLETDLTMNAVFAKVAEACRDNGKAWGCPVGGPEDLAAKQALGGQLLAHGGEFAAIMNALAACSKDFDNNPR